MVRKPVVTVRAGLGDAMNSVGEAFMRIFSKPRDDAPNSWTGTGTSNNFSGKIDHSSRRPFQDGYQAGGQKYNAAVAAQAEEAPVDQQGNEVMGYVGEALERVVGHNFTGDETEPTVGTGSAGWKGDLHDRKTDG